MAGLAPAIRRRNASALSVEGDKGTVTFLARGKGYGGANPPWPATGGHMVRVPATLDEVLGRFS
jgi:hypothetical protein